jgi:type VI secretion system VasD/TssJ family lipoprotein
MRTNEVAMKNIAKFIYLFSFLVIFSACGGSSGPPIVAATFCKECIRVDVVADQQLNLHQGLPHTLKLCLYQLSDQNNFNQLTNDMNGLYDLLECKRIDPSIKVAQQEFIHPGKDRILLVDRAEGTMFVGIVAGYYNLRKESIIELHEIPVSGSFFSKNLELDQLNLRLQLGPQQIEH